MQVLQIKLLSSLVVKHVACYMYNNHLIFMQILTFQHIFFFAIVIIVVISNKQTNQNLARAETRFYCFLM